MSIAGNYLYDYNKFYKSFAMKLFIERNENSWVIMIEDMLGRRRYNNETYETSQKAMDFLNKEFNGYDDIKPEIK